MKMELSTEGEIHACHSLKDIMPKGHVCAAMHGHTWRVKIALEYEDGQCEFNIAVDFGQLKSLIKALDHKNLDMILPFPATAENLSRYFVRESARLVPAEILRSGCTVSAEVWETAHNCAKASKRFVPRKRFGGPIK